MPHIKPIGPSYLLIRKALRGLRRWQDKLYHQVTLNSTLVFNIETNIIVISYDVLFLESTFPICKLNSLGVSHLSFDGESIQDLSDPSVKLNSLRMRIETTTS
jgi:hypothetical protein